MRAREVSLERVKRKASRDRSARIAIAGDQRAEDALRESEEKYRSVIENANIGILVIQDGRRVFYNSRIYHMYGYTKKEYDDIDFMSIVHPDDRSYVVDRIRRRLAGELKDLEIVEVRTIPKSREVMWVEANSSVIQWKGKPAVQVFVADITERKKIERALIERERLLNDVGKIAKIGGWEMDLEKGGRAIWTKETYDIAEIDPGDPVPGADEHVSWYLPEYREMIEQKIKDLIETRQPMRFEAMLKTKRGNLKWCQAIGEVVEENGKVVKLRGFFQDITERKKAEERVQKYQSKLKAMASQLSTIQEQQRRHLAVEMHDRVTQKLAMTKLGLETAAASFVDPDAAEKIKGIAEQVGQTMEDAYALMLELSNPVLYEIGLKAALDTLLHSDYVKNCGITCKLVTPGQPLGIDTDIRVALYQSARELLVNAIKYSKATRIDVRLEQTPEAVGITVKDNGVGFDPSDVKPPGMQGGFGLFNIRESVGGLGGEFVLETKSGEGTSASAWLPLPFNVSPV